MFENVSWQRLVVIGDDEWLSNGSIAVKLASLDIDKARMAIVALLKRAAVERPDVDVLGSWLGAPDDKVSEHKVAPSTFRRTDFDHGHMDIAFIVDMGGMVRAWVDEQRLDDLDLAPGETLWTDGSDASPLRNRLLRSEATKVIMPLKADHRGIGVRLPAWMVW